MSAAATSSRTSKQAARYIVPAIHDLAAARTGQPFRAARGLPGGLGVAEPGRLRGHRDDRRGGARHGGLGCAGQGGRTCRWPCFSAARSGRCPPTTATACGSPTSRRSGEEAAELVAEGGFKGLKLRLGRDRLADDLAAIAARARGGRRGREADGATSTRASRLGDALHRCHALDDQGLYWFEEPIAYDNLAGYAAARARARRRRSSSAKTSTGRASCTRRCALGAGDYVMPDLMRIGGVTGWLRAAAIAGAAGIEMSTHLYPEVSAHLMRVTETAHWLEWQDWADPDPRRALRGEERPARRAGPAGMRHRVGRKGGQALSGVNGSSLL